MEIKIVVIYIYQNIDYFNKITKTKIIFLFWQYGNWYDMYRNGFSISAKIDTESVSVVPYSKKLKIVEVDVEWIIQIMFSHNWLE